MGSSDVPPAADVVVRVDGRAVRRLAALEAAYAEQAELSGDPSLDRAAMLNWIVSRGVAELYEEFVPGTEFDLRRRHRDERSRARRGGLRVV